MEQYFATADILKHSCSEFIDLYVGDEEREKELVSHINNLLNTARTRHKGLLFLTECLPNLSLETLSEYAFNWVKLCTSQHSGDALSEVKLVTMYQLLTCCSSNQDFAKKFTSDHLPKTVEICLEPTSNFNHSEAALNCLIVILLKYPNWFNPHVKKVENFLFSFLDHSCDSVVKKCSLAFHYLQQSGGGGLNRINYINNFSVSFHRLLVTARSLLIELTEDFLDVDESTKLDFTPYDIPAFASATDSIEVCHKITRRLINILTFMTTMIQKQFAAIKTIRPKLLIDFLERGIAIHICLSSKETSLETWHKSLLLKKIQTHLLHLLKSTIIWLQTNSFPFAYMITKMLADLLIKSEKCKCFGVNFLFEKSLYNTLIQWLNVIKSVHPNFQIKIFNVILNNIIPSKNKVSLNIDISISKGKSKKLKRKAMEDRIISSSSSAQSNLKQEFLKQRIINENKTKLSLKLAKTILKSVSTGLNKNLLSKLYKTVTDTALDIQANRIVDPYNDMECQMELYEVILAVLEQENVEELISIHSLCDILNNGAKNVITNISSTCERGLSILEKISQPICPYLSSNITMNRRCIEDGFNISSNTGSEDNIIGTLNSCIENEGDLEENQTQQIDDQNVLEDTEDKYTCKKLTILDVKVIKPNDEECEPEQINKRFKLNGHDSSLNETNRIEKENVDEVFVIDVDVESDKDVEIIDEKVEDCKKTDNMVIECENNDKNSDLLSHKTLEVTKIDSEEKIAVNKSLSKNGNSEDVDMLDLFVDEVNY